MKLIWNIEVRTIKETGKEAMMPAAEDLSPTSRVVLKEKYAMPIVKNNPRAPLESAAYSFLVIKKTINKIGSRVKATDRNIRIPSKINDRS